MSGLVTVTAGLTLYLLFAAAIGYWYGEAPGGLDRLMAGLRGEEPVRRKPWWWAAEGQLSPRQSTGLTVLAAAVLFTFGLLFFRSWVMAFILILAAPFYPRALERTLRRKRRDLLESQFGMALRAMAASLRAGASLRTAVERTATDLEQMLAGQPLTPMVDELERVKRDLQMGFSLEEALIRFRDRVQLEDVTDFVGAVLLCRVRGGNAAEVMARISEIIEDKISVRQQIVTLTAGKRAEAKMIIFAPPLMVILLGFTSPDYLTPLYEMLEGQIMLLVGTALLAAAYFIGRRVMEIEV